MVKNLRWKNSIKKKPKAKVQSRGNKEDLLKTEEGICESKKSAQVRLKKTLSIMAIKFHHKSSNVPRKALKAQSDKRQCQHEELLTKLETFSISCWLKLHHFNIASYTLNFHFTVPFDFFHFTSQCLCLINKNGKKEYLVYTAERH